MSRKPPTSTNSRTANGTGSLVRAPSSSNLNNNNSSMPPPPSRMPTRPGSAMSASTTRAGGTSGADEGSRANSPTRKRVVSGEKRANKVAPVEKVGEDGEMNIQVVVRCRGRSAMEVSQRTPIICQTSGAVSSAITIETSHSAMSNTSGLGLPVTTLPYSERAPVSKTYGFDRVFGPEADQTIVYKEVVENMLDEVIAGYNCTIFAYGQTGTGKTYTMQGDISLTPLGKPCAEAGIIPRVLHRLFSLLESVPNAEFSVKCSYVELYNEELRDLLASEFHQPVALGGPGSTAQGTTVGGLKIYEDANKKGGVTIQGLEESSIRNAKEGLGLLTKGSQRRQVAETKMNTESSRSHSIFSLTVHIKESSVHGGEDLLKVGKLNLVDLAGSEAIGRSGAENKRAREAGMINQSLLTLGRVISALVEKNSHVPYRESKLTRLLQDSLGGRTKTCIVATVSPTKSNMEETLSTLDYAIRAKTIRNKPEINQRLTKGTLIKDYVVEIERLKNDLSAAHEKNGIYFSAETWGELSAEHEETKNQLEDIKQRADALENKHATLTAEFEANMVMLLAREEELVGARQEALELKAEIERVQAVVVELTRKVEEERWVGEKYRKGEERIDGIAKGLKGTVVESLNDVGGLFAKIARKADVLNANAGSTSAYSQKLNSLADRLHQDMDVLKTVQTDFGGTLQRELEALAKRGAESLEQDKAFLTSKLSSFSASMESFKQEGHKNEATMSRAIDQLRLQQEQVHKDLVEWTISLRDLQREAHERIAGEHAAHLQEVHGSIEHMAETLDVLIDGAVEQTEHETESSQALQKVATQMHEREVAHLRSQNERLASLLQQEQQTSARLRDDLVSQITSLLTGFTTAQSASLDKAIRGVQTENDEVVLASRNTMTTYSEAAVLADQRSTQYRKDLEVIRGSHATNREDAGKAVEDTRSLMRDHLDHNLEELETRVSQHRGTLDRSVEQSLQGLDSLNDTMRHTSKTAAAGVERLNGEAAANLNAAKERIVVAKEDIKVVSQAVLSAHSAAEPLFAQHCSQAQGQVEQLRSIHHDFVASVREDVSTGSTPRKRAWNVPAAWQTTQPREALLQRYRTKLQDAQDAEPRGTDDDGEVLYQTIGETSISIPAFSPEQFEEATTTPDSVPTTPVEESPAFSRVSASSSTGEHSDLKRDVYTGPQLEEDMQQENIPPLAALLPKELASQDNGKIVGHALPKAKPRAAHVRSNSTLGESVTASNIPMRKTRRGA